MIEQASSIVQNLFTDSEFVIFAKNQNLGKKITNQKYEMQVVYTKMLKKLDNKEQIPLRYLYKLKKIYYKNEDY